MPQAVFFKPGDKVPRSGIYAVTHDSVHIEGHEVTAVMGETFPPCNQCGSQPRFRLVRAANLIGTHEAFRSL